MNLLRRRLGTVLILCGLIGLQACEKSRPAAAAGPDGTPSPAQSNPIQLAGYWEGSLEVQGLTLRLGFDVIPIEGGNFKATFDSFDQGVRDLPASVKQEDEGVTLTVDLKQAGKGNFKGKPGKDGRELEGFWTQGPASLPLTLKRGDRARAAEAVNSTQNLSPEELTENKEAAKRIAGVWNGTLNVQGKTLRLSVELEKQPDGTAHGTLVSLDQGNAKIPISLVSLKGDHVFLEMPAIGGNFHGTLSADSKSAVGKWTQLGRSHPLTLQLGIPPGKP